MDELLGAFIFKFSARIAPLAIVLVDLAVRLAAQGLVVKRYAAALADELSRLAEQCVYGNNRKALIRASAFRYSARSLPFPGATPPDG